MFSVLRYVVKAVSVFSVYHVLLARFGFEDLIVKFEKTVQLVIILGNIILKYFWCSWTSFFFCYTGNICVNQVPEICFGALK